MSSYCHIPPSLQVKKHIKQGQGHEGGIFSVEAPFMPQMFRLLTQSQGMVSYYERVIMAGLMFSSMSVFNE